MTVGEDGRESLDHFINILDHFSQHCPFSSPAALCAKVADDTASGGAALASAAEAR